MKFLDRAKIYVEAGKGGDGCASFRREACVEFGGPDGGDGGRGGHVYAEAADNLNTLIDFRYRPHHKAGRGGNGRGKQCHGRNGDDKTLKVPTGTQILESDGTTLLADMTQAGQCVLIARGGNGGWGNIHFKTATNRAPRRANTGETGETFMLWLHLKLIADAGLLGLPNAGKSTFLAQTTAANPKIADYPFTTLHPGLGLVSLAPDKRFILADIPGLVAGAAQGAGLGHRFLGHMERCRLLIHLIDCTLDDPVHAYRTVRTEIKAYDSCLFARPELVVLSKIDQLHKDQVKTKAARLQDACAHTPECMSAMTGAGLDRVLQRMAAMLAQSLQTETASNHTWSPLD